MHAFFRSIGMTRHFFFSFSFYQIQRRGRSITPSLHIGDLGKMAAGKRPPKEPLQILSPSSTWEVIYPPGDNRTNRRENPRFCLSQTLQNPWIALNHVPLSNTTSRDSLSTIRFCGLLPRKAAPNDACTNGYNHLWLFPLQICHRSRFVLFFRDTHSKQRT